MEELQVENGKYTRIVNSVIEQLIKVPFRGKELNVCMFIIRKTWGFNKKEDAISLTQFEKALNLSRPTIIKALKNLQLVKIVKLVKRGDSIKDANVYSFNKYFETWKLVKKGLLVKSKRSTSKELDKELVKTGLHTKDNTKDKQKTAPKISKIIVDILLKEMDMLKPDGDYQKDNLFQVGGLVKNIKESYKKAGKENIDDNKVIEGFLYILNGMDEFHKNNATSIRYINKNYNKIVNSINK